MTSDQPRQLAQEPAVCLSSRGGAAGLRKRPGYAGVPDLAGDQTSQATGLRRRPGYAGDQTLQATWLRRRPGYAGDQTLQATGFVSDLASQATRLCRRPDLPSDLALYQGTTSVVPLPGQKGPGFSPCALYQSTTSVVPKKRQIEFGL